MRLYLKKYVSVNNILLVTYFKTSKRILWKTNQAHFL